MNSGETTQSIDAVTLRSPAGFEVTLLNIGATIQGIRVPTETGVIDAILGYGELDKYRDDNFYLGSTVGRFANRIGGARFSLDGRSYTVDSNDGANCLHGGKEGFHRQFWTAKPHQDETAVEYTYVSPDGECGFPGELEIAVKYQIVDDFSLLIEYRATSSAETVVNIANHAYFNLDAEASLIDSHEIQIEADAYTPVDEQLIPSGEICAVDETRFDLRNRTSLQEGQQYDHNFVIAKSDGSMRRVATLSSPQSGLMMHLHTTQIALQFYTGEFLTDRFPARAGLCLETQGFPDSPNQPSFPSARLAPGELYQQRTIYEFVPGKPCS